MAEANSSSGSGSGRTRKWFCHKCNREIGQVSEDYKCPQCLDSFIEEIDESNAATGGGGGGGGGGNPNPSGGFSFAADFGGGGGGRGVDLFQLLRGLSEPGGGIGVGGGGGHSDHGGSRGPNNSGQRSTNVRFAPGTQNYRRSASDGSGGQTANFSFLLDPYSMQGVGGGGNPDQMNPENMLFSFLNDLITGLGGGQFVGGTATPVVSNLGDYVWGRDGFDAIVTQLMNQMEGTGPAPLPEDKIETLPDVTISQEQVDRKLQCSVCWDDFVLDEKVKQLECEHLYHPDCIIPWLKLHGTCPICRKDLTGEESNAETNASSPSASAAPGGGQTSSSSATSPNSSHPSTDNTGNPNNPQAPSRNRSGSGSSQNFGPAAGFANILLNQILPGLNQPQPTNPDRDNSSSSNTTGSSRDRNQQRRDGDGRSSGNQSRGFDYMDEFD